MKSKKALLALALPVALAACTADDFITEQSGNSVMPGRKTVGNITFVAPENADTRLVWDSQLGGLKWTDTDRLGAALMDEYTPSGSSSSYNEEDPASNYTIGDLLFSNYRYDYVDGAFVNNNATFVEGNYFVYAQFKDVQKRSGLAYEIPAVQQSGEDGRGSWYANQMWLDHIFVKEGDSQVAVNPLPVFPLVTLKANYEGSNGGVVIRKIVVTDGTTKFGNVGTVQPSESSVSYDALSGLTATGVAEDFDADDYKITTTSKTLADVFNVYKKAVEDLNDGVYTITKKNDKLEDVAAGVKDIVNPNIADYFVADATTKSSSLTLEFTNESASVAGVMIVPQQIAARASANMTFEIYTNKGLVTISGVSGNTMSNQFSLGVEHKYGTDPATGAGDELIKNKADNAIYFDGGIGASFLSTSLSAGQQETIQFGFKDDAILVPNALTVTNTEELKYYLTNWYTGKANQIIGVTDNNTVTINAQPTANGKVEIDNEVLNFMAASGNPTLNFEGTVTIPAGTNANALDLITKRTGNLSVINESVLTWEDKAKTFTSITNKGTLTIGQATGSAEAFIGNITNLGTLTLQANVTTVVNGSATAPANNTAVVTLKKGTVTALTNNAVVNIEGTATITTLTNNYTVEVKSGTLNTEGSSSTNTGNITVAKDATWVVGGTFENKGNTETTSAAGLVTNNGKITVNGVFENKASEATTDSKKVDAKVINYGQIACGSGQSSAFNNNGDMEAKDNSITLITLNAAGAEIVVTDKVLAVNVPDGSDLGKITFIVSEQSSMSNIPSVANSLKITSESIDFNGMSLSDIKYVEFVNVSSVSNTKAGGNNSDASFEKVIFNGGTCTIKADFTATKTLEITESTTIIINEKLTYANSDGSEFTNAGNILIVGTLEFSKISSSNQGTVTLGDYLFTGGSSSNIVWSGN